MGAKSLAFGAAVAVALAQPAAAVVMQATFTGTVSASGNPLHGRAFTAVFRYNTEVGNLTLLDGIQIRSGGAGFVAPSPMQFISMRIAGAPQYNVTVGFPDDYASVGNYASAFNQFYGTNGFINIHSEHDLRDDAVGYLEFASFRIGGFAPTGLTLATPFAGAVTAAGQNEFLFSLVSNHVLVRSLQVGLLPTYVTVQTAGGVPEPASWALMIIGFGLTGAALRRRTATTRLAGA